MSTDRRDNDREGDEKHREMLEESPESVGEERRESVHSDGGSPIPRNQDVHVKLKVQHVFEVNYSSKVLSPSDGEKKEKHREGSERDHQDIGYSSKESSLLGKRSHSERSPQHPPEKMRKMSDQESNEDREKKRERSVEEHRYSGKESSQSSSGSQNRSHSEKSPQYSPEKRRKTSETTDSEVKVDERRIEKQRERSEERRYSNKESSHSSSSSRKRSHSPSSSERKSSDTRRFKIPKKEHKADDLREKLDKKPDRREAERKASEMSQSSSSSSSSRKERPITSSALKKEIKDLLRTEHHHLMKRGKMDSNGDIQGVEWCYKYLDPSIRGHITGGRAILHHRCRQCNRICLHLLGKYGTGKRMCLTCAARESGWKEKEVPTWYYHDDQECSNCRNTRYDRPNSGSYYYSRY